MAFTRYGLGARGVDLIERTVGSTVTTGFPVYDAHGNNVATLSRNGSGGFALADRRTYDAWGVVRSQQSGGDPKLRYCASLGHKQDDESGLVYMRARYYEPTSGRFVNQDPGHQGTNWFSYCKNNPISLVDSTGQSAQGWFGIGVGLFLTALLVGCPEIGGGSPIALNAAIFFATMAVAAFAGALNDCPNVCGQYGPEGGNILGFLTAGYGAMIGAILFAAEAGKETQACAAVLACATYALVIIAALAVDDDSNTYMP